MLSLRVLSDVFYSLLYIKYCNYNNCIKSHVCISFCRFMCSFTSNNIQILLPNSATIYNLFQSSDATSEEVSFISTQSTKDKISICTNILLMPINGIIREKPCIIKANF